MNKKPRLSKSVRELWPKLTTAALDLLFPGAVFCASCGTKLKTAERYICTDCLEQITLVKEPVCLKCNRPLTRPGYCRECRVRPRSFARAWSAAVYKGALRQCLHRFKYSHGAYLAPFLGELLANHLEKVDNLPPQLLVIPVPLDSQRLKERGFNQAQLLAEEVARLWGWPLDTKILRRVRATLPQADLKAADRWRNVEGAFAASRRLMGKQILLVDDIYTTGATAEAASQALKDAGASAVYIATVAIASSHPHGRDK
ncbi:MAG: ComF family protein [Firmicutes bacterium]|nr:ComF family protein [Bacillota bacterium]